MVLFTMGNAITMVCLGDLVGTLVLWNTKTVQYFCYKFIVLQKML